MSTTRKYHDTYEHDRFQVQGPLRECRSIRSGFCGLPYYCLVCVPGVIGGSTVWWHSKPNPKPDEMQNSLLFRVCVVHPCCVFSDVSFVLYLFCLSTCVCVCLQVQGPLRECPRASRFQASLFIWYFTPPVCIPAAIGALALWRQNTQKTKIV